MPNAPLRPCPMSGCPELTRGGRCAHHQQEQRRLTDAARADVPWRKWYFREPWKTWRLQFLRANPLCCECQVEGRIEAATIVDHIIPHKGDWSLFSDHANWSALCKRHHDHKPATQDGAFGRVANR